MSDKIGFWVWFVSAVAMLVDLGSVIEADKERDAAICLMRLVAFALLAISSYLKAWVWAN